MPNGQTPRVRRSITELQDAYDNGNKKPLEDLMRAWKGIKELPPDNPNSFFVIGGYHGEPFRGAGWGNAGFWGGYCRPARISCSTVRRSPIRCALSFSTPTLSTTSPATIRT